MRWWPLTQYAAWGSDQGEYGAILDNYMALGGQMPEVYRGWGGAYPDFPGLYAFASAFSSLSGVDAFVVLTVVVPAAASLTALLSFAMTLRITGSLRTATLAGAIVASAMPEAFAASHGMPGALGGMLALAIMAAVLVGSRAPGARGAVVILALALIPTHHLSAYMAAVALGGAAFVEAKFAVGDRARSRAIDSALLGAGLLLLGSVFFWSFGAPHFRETVLDRASPLLGRVLPAIAVFAVLGLVIVIWYLETTPRSLLRVDRIVDEQITRRRFSNAAILTVLAVAVAATVGIPGTSVVVPPGAALAYLPLAFLFSATVAGVGRVAPVRGAAVPLGATGGILASMFVGGLLFPTVLLPYRHLQYLVGACAPLSAAAIAFASRALSIEAFPGRHALQRPVGAALLAALILASTATAYPSKDALGGFQEGTTASETAAIVWLRWDVPQTLVASDHRLSSLAFGYANKEATWEASEPILAGDAATAQAALQTAASPSGRTGVTTVLLTDDVVAGAALQQWEPARPITGEALAKFDGPPFVKVFDNGDAVAYWAVSGA